MKDNQYQHIITLDNGTQCYYDTLTGDIQFSKGRDIPVEIRKKEDNKKLLEDIQLKNIANRNQLYLVLTHKCNLSCAYCRQSQDFSGSSNMSFETAIESIKVIDEEAEGLESIVFYGGEPLVNLEVLKKTVNYVRENYGDDIELSVITNGTLVTSEIAEYLVDNDVFCALSLDGHLPEHNSYRMNHGDENVYNDIMKALDIMISKGIKVGISCTVGPHNIDSLGDFTEWAVKKENVGNIYFALPHYEETGLLSDGISNEMWRDSFLDAFNRAGYFVENLARIMNDILNGQFKKVTCPACGGRLVVRPDGKYGVCTGSLVEGDTYYRSSLSEQSELGKKWAESNSPINDDNCQSCIAFRVCGGGCPYDAFNYTGSFKKKDKRRCEITKNIVLSSLEWIVENIDFDDDVYILEEKNRKELKNKFTSKWFTPLHASSTFGGEEE